MSHRERDKKREEQEQPSIPNPQILQHGDDGGCDEESDHRSSPVAGYAGGLILIRSWPTFYGWTNSNRMTEAAWAARPSRSANFVSVASRYRAGSCCRWVRIFMTKPAG